MVIKTPSLYDEKQLNIIGFDRITSFLVKEYFSLYLYFRLLLYIKNDVTPQRNI